MTMRGDARLCIVRVVDVWRGKWLAFSLYRGRQSLAIALLRWGAWGVRCALRWPAVIGLPRYQMRLYLVPHWRGCWKALYVFRERFFEVSEGPELDLTRRLLQPGDAFVDAGAFHGWYAVVASRAVGPSGRVLAFEPNPETYRVLVRNLALNACANVLAFNVALSDTDGEAWLYQGPADGSYSALAEVDGWTRRVRVSTRRLDAVVNESTAPRVAMMKADVEGAEVMVLRGAADVLAGSRPVVVFEVNATVAGMGFSPMAAWGFLDALHYRFFRVLNGRLIPLSAFPRLEREPIVNVVAVPADADRLPPGMIALPAVPG
jgi:FkbM family methyltransferase